MTNNYPPTPWGKKRIFCAWVTKNGRRIYASDYGKKAFTFLVDA